MAQGKLKVKTNVPTVKEKNKNKNKNTPAIQRRNNAPIQPKKRKFEETHKLKQMITKTVNKAMEIKLREKALEGKMSLTKKETATSKKK
ncbi:hypothetical protein E2986_13172 [Frieseomelitta varia]|uniref:Uncharacterized protein n=1 Tax=Frieseomelitta varia TaxID=561572 RepID=A0A833SF70_9HYME|nr:uncharacterized protein LOC122530889 [Frieseomelitta varia]XP_043514203.1 uncharacterized protein LOC122530889 [Frieseomelitta varia]XP_043514204.1 uncharacterized protein LOC122530889 [Frieseomelitta varia]KAF3430596.1 hypothetical protein E2986_13172 [Frieseomelitta varia]